MQNKRSLWFAGAIFACATILQFAISGATFAATITQTGFFSDISDGNFFTSPGALPSGFFFAEEAITGIDKFDPALGTLVGVTVTADFEASYIMSVFADDVIDDSLSHSVDVDADFLSAFIGYTPGGGTSTFTLVSIDFSPATSCFGDPFSGPCSDAFDELDFVSDMDTVSDLGSYDSSDFVGLGPVSALSAIIAIPDDALFFLDNVGTASSELFADMTYFDLTVEYEYTPIPEPTTLVGLSMLGFAAMARRRRHA